jgi:hypothetical protein
VARASIFFPDFSRTQQAATNKIYGETEIHPCGSGLSGRERILAETLRQRGNCLVTKKQFGRRFIKRREECIDSQVTNRLQLYEGVCPAANRYVLVITKNTNLIPTRLFVTTRLPR